MAIDTTKWTVSNLDPAKVRIEKNSVIELINLGTTANADGLYLRNSIVSIKGAVSGKFGFTATSIYPMDNIYQSFGLYVDANNRIEFYRRNTGDHNIAFRIIYGGMDIYSVNDVAKDFGKYEIIIAPSNLISAYIFNGTSWTKIGESQTAEMGEKKIFAASCGGAISKLSLSYCYIKLW